MRRARSKLFPLLALCIATGFWLAGATTGAFGDEPTPSVNEVEADKEQIKIVQSEVRTLALIIYEGETDEIIEALTKLTHPKVIALSGGPAGFKKVLEDAVAQLRSTEIEFESFAFSEPPTFLATDENEYVIVPMQQVLSINDKRVESNTYQFGHRPKGTEQWKYMDGSSARREIVLQFFPDFPQDYEFP